MATMIDRLQMLAHGLFIEFVEILSVWVRGCVSQEPGEYIEAVCDGLALLGTGLAQRLKQRVKCQFRHLGIQKLANCLRGDEEGDAAIGWMGTALNETLFYEPVDDARDGAVRQTNGRAELLKAETTGANESGHDQPLRTGKIPAGELSLEALTHAAPDDVELAFRMLRKCMQFGG